MAAIVGPSLVCAEKPVPRLSLPGLSGINTRAHNDPVSILAPAVSIALSGLQKTYSGSCRVPVVGRFARFGVAATDVCLSRVTPWSGCAEIGEQLNTLAMYLDKEVLTTAGSGQRGKGIPEPSELSFAAQRRLFESPESRGGTANIFVISSPVNDGGNVDFHFIELPIGANPEDECCSNSTQSRSSSNSSEFEHGLGAAVGAPEEDLEAVRFELQALCEEFRRQSARGEALDADAVSNASSGSVSSRRILAPVVGTALGGMKMVYLGSCSVPVVRRIARFGASATNACLSRVTPWSGCGEVGDLISRLAMYLDKAVLSPRPAEGKQSFSDGGPELSKLPVAARRIVCDPTGAKAPEAFPKERAEIISISTPYGDRKTGEFYFIGLSPQSGAAVGSGSAESERGLGQASFFAFEGLEGELQSLCQQLSQQTVSDEVTLANVETPAELRN